VPGTKKPSGGGGAKAPAPRAAKGSLEATREPVSSVPASVESAAYEQFLELTTDGVWRYDVRPSVSTKLPEREQAEAILARARLGFCNRAFARLYGFENSEELVGVPLGRLLAGTDEDKIRCVAESVRTGYRFADVEVMTQKREGQTVWTLNNVAGVVKRGRLVCGWGTSRDITERKSAEKALQEAHADLHATLAAFPDLVFEVDAEGRIHKYHAPTPERLYAPPAAFLGKPMAEVIPPEPARAILDALEEAAQHGSHRGAMYALDLPGGRRWFDLSIAAKGSFSSHASSRWRTRSKRWRRTAHTAPPSGFRVRWTRSFVGGEPSMTRERRRPASRSSRREASASIGRPWVEPTAFVSTARRDSRVASAGDRP